MMSEHSTFQDPADVAGPRLSELLEMIDRLGAPLAEPVADHRVLPPADGAPWSPVLDEVDATVMARRLVFRSGSGERMLLDIRNRRLLRAEFKTDDRAGASDLQPCIIGLSYAGADRLAAFRRALRIFCNRSALSVESLPATDSPEPDETGISASFLRKVLARTETAALPAADARQPADLAGFASERGCDARSWALMDAGSGALLATSEPPDPRLEDALPHLGELAIALGSDEKRALVLTPSDAGLGRLCLLTDDDMRMACLLAPEALEDFLLQWSFWQATQGA